MELKAGYPQNSIQRPALSTWQRPGWALGSFQKQELQGERIDIKYYLYSNPGTWPRFLSHNGIWPSETCL